LDYEITVTVHLIRTISCAARSTRFLEPDQPDATRPAAPEKIIRFRHNPNHRYHLARPPRQEGRIAIVTDAGWDAVDAAASGAIVVAGRVLP
jgi:hypothetical protein